MSISIYCFIISIIVACLKIFTALLLRQAPGFSLLFLHWFSASISFSKILFWAYRIKSFGLWYCQCWSLFCCHLDRNSVLTWSWAGMMLRCSRFLKNLNSDLQVPETCPVVTCRGHHTMEAQERWGKSVGNLGAARWLIYVWNAITRWIDRTRAFTDELNQKWPWRQPQPCCGFRSVRLMSWRLPSMNRPPAPRVAVAIKCRLFFRKCRWRCSNSFAQLPNRFSIQKDN
jgi:hypothetical protein